MPRKKVLVMLSQESKDLIWIVIILITMAMVGAGLAVVSKILSSRDYGVKVQSTMIEGGQLPAAPEGDGKSAAADSGVGVAAGFSFDTSRIERDRARAQRMDLLKDLMAQASPGSSQAKDAEAEFARLMDTTEKEMQIEELVRAKGYKDVIAFLGSGVCNVIVKTRGLTEKDAATIGDIAVRVSGLPLTKISIVERQELANQW